MPQPNILLILVDSARHNAYALNGGQAQAPAYERLCRQGVQCRRAWSTTPICHPSRASLITGLYPFAHGMLTNGPFAGGFPFRVHPHVPALPQMLREAGYRTAYAGQMHIVLPGWDDDRHQTTRDYMQWLRGRGYEEAAEGERRYWLCGDVEYTVDETREGRFAARALDLLDDLAPREGPWFLQLDFDGPHPACWIPRDATQYDPAEVRLPASLHDDLSDRPEWVRLAWERQGGGKHSEDEWRQLIAHYHASVTMIDGLIGRVLDRLDQHGVADDTLVVFTSDHATPVGIHGFAMHGGPPLYESVLRVPLAMRWPNGLPAGQPLDAAVQHVDLVPTLLEAAGVETDRSFHGRSVLAALRGQPHEPWPDESLHVYDGTGANFFSVRACHHEGWKLVYTPNGGDELYHLETDPEERANLVGKPEVAAHEQRVRQAMVAAMERVKDPLASQAKRDAEVAART